MSVGFFRWWTRYSFSYSYCRLSGSVPQEYQDVFILDSSSSILNGQLEIYNNKERKRFRSKKSSMTRKDSLKLLRKSIESRSPEEEKVSRKLCKEIFSQKMRIWKRIIPEHYMQGTKTLILPYKFQIRIVTFLFVAGLPIVL